MVARRAVLRLAVLTAIAPSLAACGDSGDAPDPGGLDLVKSDLARSTGRPDAIPETAEALHGLAGDLYGRPARVSFVSRLRDEERFDSVEALVDQMAADVEATRVALGWVRAG